MTEVWTIIVTYNNSKYMRQCLSGFANSTIPTHIVIVDNCSVDDTTKIITSEYNQVHLIQNKKNLGFGAANNIGINYARSQGAEYFFLLNQDAWINKDTLKTLIDIQQAHCEYGIVAPLQVNEDWQGIEHTFSSYLTPENTAFFEDDSKSNALKDIYATKFMNAAGWLLTKACVETVGGFDNQFFMYGEDADYVHRLLYHGFKIGIVPTSKIVHVRNNVSPLAKKSENKKEELQKQAIRYGIRKLSEVKNINKDFSDERSRILSEISKILLKTFLLGNFAYYRLLKNEKKKFISHLPQVQKNRKIVSSKSPSFLIAKDE